jgi:hypothetical protein
MKIIPIVTSNGSDASNVLSWKGPASLSAFANTLQA